MTKTEEIEIMSRDYWFKVVDMLQQNWAIIELSKDEESCTVYFIGDTSGVFDQMEFDTVAEAERQLRINGFGRYEEEGEARQFLVPPPPPFRRSHHPNGEIYSSGRYWKSA